MFIFSYIKIRTTALDNNFTTLNRNHVRDEACESNFSATKKGIISFVYKGSTLHRVLPSATMSRAFCIPGVIFLVCALVLNFLVSISLPYLPALDITRVHFPTSVSQSGTTGVQELRVCCCFNYGLFDYLFRFIARYLVRL